MSLKLRRSRGGWQVWRCAVFQAVPPIGGKTPKPRKLKPIKIKGGMTRGEAKNAIMVANYIDDMVRRALYDHESTYYYQYSGVSVDNNYGASSDTLPDELSGLGLVPEVQPEDLQD